MTTTTFVPPLAQRLIDRFELTETAVTDETVSGTHTGRAVRLWAGTAWGVDDGYDFAEHVVNEFSWRPNPNYGDWPMLIEWFRVHDPKDDPDETGRLFYWIRLTYIEKGLYVALYTSKADAAADARRHEED